MQVWYDLLKYPVARKIVFENLFDLNNPTAMSFVMLRNMLQRMMKHGLQNEIEFLKVATSCQIQLAHHR